MTLNGRPAVKVVYSTVSAPNSCYREAGDAGCRPLLHVECWASTTAVVDLGTPQGVDNVDAYRLMIESFRWKQMSLYREPQADVAHIAWPARKRSSLPSRAATAARTSSGR